MMMICTFITAAGQSTLPEWVAEARALLAAAGYEAAEIITLSPLEAMEFTLHLPPTTANLATIRNHVTGWLAQRPIDVIIQPALSRRKALLVADMESTIIEQEMLDEMAKAFGKGDEIAVITQKAMNGEMDFVQALQQRVAAFAEQPFRLVEDLAVTIRPMAGAASLVATMKHHGARCILASGGFRCFTNVVAQQLGFDRDYANLLVVKEGALTGTVHEPVLDKNSKAKILRQEADYVGVDLSQTMTVGDGANDLPMLSLCSQAGGLGIAYRAKPAVQAQSSYIINHGDLTALLFAQGYRREEFLSVDC